MSLVNKSATDNETALTLVDLPRGAAADNDGEMEIDLLDLLMELFDKIHYIILFFLIGAVLANAFAFFCIAPTYESTAKMYIVSTSKDSVVDLTDLNIGTSLTADYEELILSYPVMDRVIKKMSLDMDADDLKEMISLRNPADTRILEIKATSTDPEEAKKLADTVAEVAVSYLPETMSTNAPNIAQKAKLADHKAGPSYSKFTLIGAFLGALIYCAWVVFLYMTDDTVHTAEDMEKYFGIVPLTSIPNNELFVDYAEEQKEKGRKRFRLGRRK
ncbi:MAG: capsular polysaccharide biosynthesis protein [Eubacterium sp.]|nr:capsular polysaccharide biosynthesis protein [Eubacterium sp.]